MTFHRRFLPGLALGIVVALTGCSKSDAPPANESVSATASAKTVDAPEVTTEASEIAKQCASLMQLSTERTVIKTAVLIAEGEAVPGAILPVPGAPEISGLPAFCRVGGSLHPEPGSDIGFEVWLPAQNWDGRFHGIGIGGFAGSIDYMTLSGSIRAGQASAATDTGHKGQPQESAWAKERPELIRDHGWRAVHLTTVTAKQLIANFYGRGPDHSYLVGCSGGGRQGLIEASRFPEDYDGIVSGAPAANWTDMAMSMINSIQAQIPADSAIRPEQAKLIETEVLNQCDAIDGQSDGLVAAPRRCDFDVAKLACSTSESPLCFTPPQVRALSQIIAGPHDSFGNKVANGYVPAGSEAGTPMPQLGWETYQLRGRNGDTAPNPEPAGSAGSQAIGAMEGQGGAGGYLLAGGLLANVVQEPFATPETFDFDEDPKRLKDAVGEDLDVKPNLTRFFDRGGKLILWHGWADAAIPPGATLDLHQKILRQSGPNADNSMQLYMVPGTQHCFGGTGPGSFGQLGAPQPGATPETNMVSALQAWVEEGRKPVGLTGRYGFSGFMGMPIEENARERLLCPEPAITVLTPDEDPNKASSYTCQDPGTE